MRSKEFLEKQSFIIESTVALEHILNKILYADVNFHKMNIKNIEETKVFKNSSPVPIRTKIDLLYDLNYFEKDTYTSLIRQIEIRNIFAHNYTINNYIDCYKILESKELLQKLYNPLKTNLCEGNIKIAIENLFKENIYRLKKSLELKNEFALKTKKVYLTYNFLTNNHPDTLIKAITKLESGDNRAALDYLKNKLEEYESFLFSIEH